MYELRRSDLLRDVFVWAYARSCKRYLAIKQTIAAPDPVRLRHREALFDVVGSIVWECLTPTLEVVRARAEALVPAQDLERFAELAMEDLMNMHEGNVSRHRLRLSEYRAWQHLQPTSTPSTEAP